MYGVSCCCDGRFDLGQWVRFAQKILYIANDRPLEGPASALTATQARLLVRINHGGLAPELAACVAWVLKLPYTLTSENAQHCLPAAQCIRATLFGKVDDLQFAPLRGHILIRKISPSHAWMCSMAQVEPLEATGS